MSLHGQFAGEKRIGKREIVFDLFSCFLQKLTHVICTHNSGLLIVQATDIHCSPVLCISALENR